MTIPAWLLMGQTAPYQISQDMLQRPANPKLPPGGVQFEKDWPLPTQQPYAVQPPLAPPQTPPPAAPQTIAGRRVVTPAEVKSYLEESGLKSEGSEVKGGADYVDSTRGRATNLISPEVARGAYNRVLGDPLPGMRELDKRGDDVAGALGKVSGLAERALGQADLSPVFGLYDDWYGTKSGESYTSPEKRAIAYGQVAQGLQNTLANLSGARSRDELDYYKAQLKNTIETLDYDKIYGGKRDVSGALANQTGLLGAVIAALGGGGRGAGSVTAVMPSDKVSGGVADAIGTLQDLHNAVGELGDNANWVGPVSGRVPAAIPNKIPGTDIEIPGTVSEQEATWRQGLERLVGSYQRAITGLAATAYERQRLDKALPSPTQSRTPEEFRRQALGFMRELTRVARNKIRAERARGKDTTALEQELEGTIAELGGEDFGIKLEQPDPGGAMGSNGAGAAPDDGKPLQVFITPKNKEDLEAAKAERAKRGK